MSITLIVKCKYCYFLFTERALCCRLQDFHFSSSLYIHHPVIMCSSVKFDDKRIQVEQNEVDVTANVVKCHSKSGDGVVESCTRVVGDKRQFQEHVETITSSSGASFSEKRCLYWYEGGDEEASILDGCTGLNDDQTKLPGNELADDNCIGDMDNCTIPHISSFSMFHCFKRCQQMLNVLSSSSMTLGNIRFSPSSYQHVKRCGRFPCPTVESSGVLTSHELGPYRAAKEYLYTSKYSFLLNKQNNKPFCSNCGNVKAIADHCCGETKT